MVLAAAILTFGVLMLPTAIHDRCLLPATALMTLTAPHSLRLFALFIWLCVTVSLNEIVCVLRDNGKDMGLLAGHRDSRSLVMAGLAPLAQGGAVSCGRSASTGRR